MSSDQTPDAPQDHSTPDPSGTPAEDRQTFVDLVEGARTCMFTTIDETGSMHSRPMAPQATDDDGAVWFLAFVDSPKVAHLTRNPQVNLAYAEGSTWVSASGEGHVVDDTARKKELWNPFAESWFQCEPDDPSVTLLRVGVTGGEYWDGPNKPAQLLGIAKALLTRTQPDGGENAKLDLQ